MEILSFILSELVCPEGCKCELYLEEKIFKKEGLASCLLLTCNFGYSKEFNTSISNDSSFDFNARTVYSMKACGKGYAGLGKS